MGDSRDELLARILVEVAARGLHDRSLRELAAAVGSSHRMLLYHFGSRDGLVRSIVEAMEAEQREALRSVAAMGGSEIEISRATWRRVSEPATLPFVRLFFELVGQVPTVGDGSRDLTESWLDVAARLGDRQGTAADREEARIGVAVIRGLLMDLVTGADRADVEASMERFLAVWQAGVRSARSSVTRGRGDDRLARRGTRPI